MLEFFQVSAQTDGKAQCRILVEPHKRQCAITVTIDRRIIVMADESNMALVKSYTPAEWHDVAHWERRAVELARHYSPFWRGETAA